MTMGTNVMTSAAEAIQAAQEKLSATPISDAQSAQSAGSSVPFAGFFQSVTQQTSALEDAAKNAVTGVLNGSGAELHDAMIATQKADLSFEFALQVRNKAVSAYQQMMSMQF